MPPRNFPQPGHEPKGPTPVSLIVDELKRRDLNTVFNRTRLAELCVAGDIEGVRTLLGCSSYPAKKFVARVLALANSQTR